MPICPPTLIGYIANPEEEPDLHNFELWIQIQSLATLAKLLAIVNKEILERNRAHH